jgi:uncharacterized protein YjiS (DUF1127 family)
MTDITHFDCVTDAHAAAKLILAMLRTVFEVAREWRRRYRSRCELASYAHHERSDLGFAADLDAEIAKPFWRE